MHVCARRGAGGRQFFAAAAAWNPLLAVGQRLLRFSASRPLTEKSAMHLQGVVRIGGRNLGIAET